MVTPLNPPVTAMMFPSLVWTLAEQCPKTGKLNLF